jgi:hypothetical protein
VGRALAHIFRGSLNRAVLAALLAALALSFIWIVAASIGRAATVRALLDHFRRDAGCNVSTATQDAIEPRPFRSLTALNFLRVALTLAAILALAGAAIVSSFASPDANPRPGLAFILFLPLAGLICITWPVLNWFLSLACIFGVRDGEDALGALSAAVALFRERSGPVFAVSTWTGLAHLAAFVGASIFAALPLAFIHVAPRRLVIAGVILVMLAYFAVADWLYMARLAGYICIAEMPEARSESATLPAPPPTGGQFGPSVPAQTGPAQTTIDRDEAILSDVSTSAAET